MADPLGVEILGNAIVRSCLGERYGGLNVDIDLVIVRLSERFGESSKDGEVGQDPTSLYG